MSETRATPSPAKRFLAVLVGLFAGWQLVFIPAANLIAFVPLRPGAPLDPPTYSYQTDGAFTACEPLQQGAERAGRVLSLWSEASGQEQGWSLFAPGPPPYSAFVAVEFQWESASDTVLSPHEPRDFTNPPVRAPLVHNRHFNFESQLVAPAWYATPEALAEYPQLAAGFAPFARAAEREIRAWLGWRLSAYRAAHPPRDPPLAVVMKHRYIPTPKPGEAPAARTVAERPFVRWHPGTDELDVFDVPQARFVPLKARP